MVRALLPRFSELGRQPIEKGAKELFSNACFYGLCPLLVGQVVAISLLLGLLSPAWHVSFVRWWLPLCFLLLGLLSLLCDPSAVLGWFSLGQLIRLRVLAFWLVFLHEGCSCIAVLGPRELIPLSCIQLVFC